MHRILKRGQRRVGISPGVLIHIGEKKVDKTRISFVSYNKKGLIEKEAKDIGDCFISKDKSTVTWINIDGLHDVGIIEKIGKHFGLHPLVMEDIVNTDQRPKVEDFIQHIFITLKIVYYDEQYNRIIAEHVSLVLGSNFVISFQERESEVFSSIRQRIKNVKGRHRSMGADYLAYSLIDSIVDNYFIALEKIGEDIEVLGDKLVTNPSPHNLQSFNTVKNEMILLRKSIVPFREVISTLDRSESDIIKKTTHVYLRDVYDNAIEVIDTIETFHDVIVGMLQNYFGMMGNKMNEVIKVLTIISTIFIPLTFFVGVYGMNFRHMPELEWVWGYYFAWLVMISIAILMLYYFSKKKWL